MKKNIFKTVTILALTFAVWFIGFKIGYNEGAFKASSKYNDMAGGYIDQFERPVYLTDQQAINKNVKDASDMESMERYGRRVMYTGQFLLIK